MDGSLRIIVEILHNKGTPLMGLDRSIDVLMDDCEIKFDMINGGEYMTIAERSIKISDRKLRKLEKLEDEWQVCEIDEMPGVILEIVKDEYKIIIENCRKFYETLRWRMGFSGDADYINSIKIFWSIHSKNEIEVTKAVFPKSDLVMIVGFNADDYIRLIKDHLDDGEPLAQYLIREAYELVDSNPKVALLVAVMALEIGVKQFLAYKVPQASWLINEIPSPPIHKIIEEYFPQLQLKVLLNEPELMYIKKLIMERNKIIHKGMHDFNLDKIYTGIRFIRNILYWLDWERGIDWASHHIVSIEID